MYIVELHNGEITTPIHNETEKLTSGNVVKGINSIDSFSFTLLPSNVGFDKIFDFQTLVTVYNTNKKRYDFYGRVLYSAISMETDGKIQKEVTCESYFGFLCDSVQTYVVERNWTVNELLSHIITTHNSQVEAYKAFQIGEVNVTDPNDNLYIGVQRANTWETINEKLIKKLGGEIRFRVVDGVNYIDYLTQIGETRATKIALSRNMKSIMKENDPSAYVTRLIPLGAKLKDENGNETEERLDITSANDGVNYIDDETAVAAYGIHVGVVEWDDVTTSLALLNKGKQWLIENNKVQVKYSITALDLSLIGLEIDDFDVYNSHLIENALLGIDDIARIIKKNINVCEEVASTIEVGDNFKTLSDIQREQLEEVKAAAQTVQTMQAATNDLKDRVSNAEVTIESLKNSSTDQSTQILNDAKQIILAALESYVEESEYSTYKESTEARLQMLSNELYIKISETLETIDNINGDLQSKYNNITKYFTFTIDGMTIGAVDNPNKVVIDNDEIAILVNGVVVQRFDAEGKALIPDLKVTKAVDLLGLHIDVIGDNFNFEYIEVT